MDPDFLRELDAHVTNVGTDECWKRPIGGRVIWFAPIPFDSQAKINETLANEDLGAAALAEAKKVTLSFSIVGIDEIDLREYKNVGEVFPVYDVRLKKEVKVTLDRYLAIKIQKWGAEFVDQAFDVFADLMVSHKNMNLKDIKFENAKDPHEELAELEMRAGELRERLGMPHLVEAGSEEATAERVGESASDEYVIHEPPPEAPLAPPRGPASRSHDGPAPPRNVAREPSQSESGAEVKYDPFKPVVTPSGPVVTPPHPAAPIPQPPDPPAGRPPQPVPSAPQVLGQGQRVGQESSPENPFPATSSSEVIERPAARVHTAPPEIDRTRQSINPRFKRQR